MLNNHYIDRYNLLAIPFLILLVAPFHQSFHIPRVFKILSLITFSIISIFSIGATHDYLSWSRARWEASHFAHDNYNINHGGINGGFEYKFTYHNKFIRLHGWEDLEYWNTTPEQFLVSFSEECKYETKNIFPYLRYFPLRTDSIFLLKKEHITPFDTITCNIENISMDGKSFITNKDDILPGYTNTRTSEKAYSGEYSVAIKRGQEYSISLKLKDIEPCEKISVVSYRFPARYPSKAVMVYQDQDHLENLDHLTAVDKPNWGRVVQEFKIPENFQDESVLFFFYNPSNEKVWFDDITIIRMK